MPSGIPILIRTDAIAGPNPYFKFMFRSGMGQKKNLAAQTPTLDRWKPLCLTEAGVHWCSWLASGLTCHRLWARSRVPFMRELRLLPLPPSTSLPRSPSLSLSLFFSVPLSLPPFLPPYRMEGLRLRARNVIKSPLSVSVWESGGGAGWEYEHMSRRGFWHLEMSKWVCIFLVC